MSPPDSSTDGHVEREVEVKTAAPQVLDLNALLADVEKMLRPLISENIEFVVVRDPALGQVKADPEQINQVLVNLAVNASDAMPEGGKLLIETANADLPDAYARSHSSVVPGRYVMLAMSDTGIRMDAETPAHIFEPFYTTKERRKGAGLRLATVYDTVKRSGGNIWVYSELGRGTTFKIYLPRVDQPDESFRATETRRLSVGASETILLVENNDNLRRLVARDLQVRGYKVLESKSHEDALEIMARCKEPIDLLLTGMVLPGMSGREIAKHVAIARPGIKVLYMSGYTNDSVVRDGVLGEGTAFLYVPCLPRILARKVREVLDTGGDQSSRSGDR